MRCASPTSPRLFDRHIVLPELLYSHVIEIDERVGAHGETVTLDLTAARRAGAGVRHGPARWPSSSCTATAHAHEQVADLAREIGFTQVSVSHEVSPLMKLVARGDTTVVDAYLSPILRRYVDQVAQELPGVRLQFMQSNGGLTDARASRARTRSCPARPAASSAWCAPAAGRLRQGDRLRHGRHLDRRVALRRRVRARVRDPGGRRAHARADDEHPHGGGRRRLDPAFRRRRFASARTAPAPTPGRPATGAAARWP
jgi:hypothetical protein